MSACPHGCEVDASGLVMHDPWCEVRREEEAARPTAEDYCAAEGHVYAGDDAGRGRCYCGAREYPPEARRVPPPAVRGESVEVDTSWGALLDRCAAAIDTDLGHYSGDVVIDRTSFYEPVLQILAVLDAHPDRDRILAEAAVCGHEWDDRFASHGERDGFGGDSVGGTQ